MMTGIYVDVDLSQFGTEELLNEFRLRFRKSGLTPGEVPVWEMINFLADCKAPDEAIRLLREWDDIEPLTQNHLGAWVNACAGA